MPKYTEKGKRLREFMDSQNWSKAEFARRMGIPQQNVNRYLAGELDPMNLAEELLKENCNIEWLMTGKSTKEGTIGEQDKLMLHILAESKIRSPRELTKLLEDKEKLLHALGPAAYQTIVTVAVAAERQAEYRARKKRGNRRMIKKSP